MCRNDDAQDLQDELLFTLRKRGPVHIVLKIQWEQKHGVLPTLEIPVTCQGCCPYRCFSHFI